MVSLSPLVAEIISPWNLLICSLNGIIHLSFIHVTVLMCVCVCVSTVSGVYKSGHHQWFYPFFPSWTFFLSGTIHLSSGQKFCQPLNMGLRFTEPLNNNPHNSLHKSLTAENKTRWKEIHFCCKGHIKDERRQWFVMLTKAMRRSKKWIAHGRSVKHLCRSKKLQLDDNKFGKKHSVN